jgi:hypothetical protein
LVVAKRVTTPYRIGWANVRPNGIELRKGPLISLRGKIKPGSIDDVSDQAVPFDASAERVIFFVAVAMV